MCVWERETECVREREREKEKKNVYMLGLHHIPADVVTDETEPRSSRLFLHGPSQSCLQKQRLFIADSAG